MLKSRLEIAQFKVGRSWQNLPFKSVEPQLEREVKLRHPEAFDDLDLHDPPHLEATHRDVEFVVPQLPHRGRPPQETTTTTTSTNHQTRPATPSSIPYATTGPDLDAVPRHGISPLKRHRSPSTESNSPELGSSPLKYRASQGALRDRIDPRSPNGLSTPPPPSTPPPSHLRSRLLSDPHSHHHHPHASSSSNTKADTEEGADLLLYLATSPSPAKGRRARQLDMSSPPAPMRASSAVNTPVGAGFNLSEFLNFSPSPAQVTRPGQRFEATGTKFSPAKLTYDDSPVRLASRRLEGI